jgi:hypothetical protein
VNADLPSIISVSNVSANGSGLYSLNSSNLVGNVANANVALVVSQASQPNITSVGLLTNLAVSNSLTTSNVFLTGNLNVQQTANIYVANIANIYTTNIVGFIGSQWTTGTGNIYYVSNVGIGTSSVSANLSVVGNIYASNALQTTNVTASGNVVVGPTPVAIQANLHVEQGNLFIGNSGVVGSNCTTSGPTNLLFFDNTSNSTVIPNKIVLFSNSAASISVGSGVFGVGPTGASVAYYTKDSHYFYAGLTSGPYCVGGFTGSSTFTVGSTPNSTNAKLWVTGGAPTSNIMARIDASNVALVTSGAGLVGFGTTVPTSNLHVVGNLYVSNAITTTNANILSIQTSNLIPATQGLFMNLQSNFTLTGNWYGNIAGTITSNLYTLFNGTGGQTWNAYGQTAGPIINGPSANGGFTFAQTGPYSMTCSIASGSGVKTLAISSNAADIHSNVTNVWSYCFRYSFGEIPSIPITLPFYVSSTTAHYYLDIETNVQGDTVYQTAYSNAASNAYTGSYVIIRPI